MGQVNLGSGSYKDYSEWVKTPAGQQSAANHRAKYGDQSKSLFPTVWQPDRNWQQQLANYRQGQSGPPVIGNAPNGRPVTGAISISQQAPSGGYDIYRPSQAQPRTTSQGTSYGQPAPRSPSATPVPGTPAMPPRQPQPTSAPMTPAGSLGGGQQPPQPSFNWRSYMLQSSALAGMPPRAAPFAVTLSEGPTSPADLPPDQRPPGFTQTFTDPFGNQTQNNPMPQRDALIQLLNQQSLPYYMGMGGRFTPNLQDLWGQAGNMVSNGWTNPLAGLFG